VRDDFNWQIGSHSITFGGTFKFIKTDSDLTSNFNNVLGGLTGGLAGGLDAAVRPANIYTSSAGIATTDYDQLFATTLGAIGSISTNFDYNNQGVALAAGSGSHRAYRYFETEAYVGDTWKVSPKLTVSYGLRYQLYSVPYEAHGNESVQFDQNTQKPILVDNFINTRLAQIGSAAPVLPISSYKLGGKANNGPNLYDPSYKDFAPRIAFAYNANPKTVVNASAGIVYDRTVINAVNFLQDQLSYLFSNTSTVNLGSGSSVDQVLATAPRLGSNLAFNPSLVPAPLPVKAPFSPFVDANGTPFGLATGQVNFITNQNLKDPYSIALNTGIQQELPGHMILRLNYVGRFGRRLLATADANQVIDVPDTSGRSTQSMAQAFAGLTTQLRAVVPVGSLTAQPWFENVLGGAGYAAANGLPNTTNLIAALVGALGSRGDISDMLQTLANYTYNFGFTGLLPNNIGIPSQFGTNAYLTNKGFSEYHGMLLTLNKNLSQGLRFDFNYTWAHSIDNTSLAANNNPLTSATPTGLICDVLQHRACRGSSDFDVRQEISSNFVYDLPFGHGREFLATTPRWMDEAIGGWSISGLPSYRTGVAMNSLSDAFLASFENDDPAIFTGNRRDLRVKINTDHSSNTVYGFAGGLAGATKALNDFQGPVGIQYGQRNLFNGPGAFYFAAGLAKTFPVISEKVNLQFRADAFNVFNHPVFAAPVLNIVNNASPFGQITATSTGGGTAAVPDGARVAQFSLRLEF
jgi:TonB dependent receptor